MSAPNNPNADHDTTPPDSPYQDSTFGDGGNISTMTLESMFADYPEKYGRTYHNYYGAQYPYLNDEQELDRLDMQHATLLHLLGGKLILAPISPSPQRILDIGTGTGIWAIDMADMYPSADVIGIDISPTQPSWAPPNCAFFIENSNKDWTFDMEFDLIHCRLLHMAVKETKLFEQSMRHLKRGGWLEIKEFAPMVCDVGNTLDWDGVS